MVENALQSRSGSLPAKPTTRSWIRKISGREWKGGRPPDMCHQLQRLFVQCPFIRVGAKWVRAPRTERDAREAVAMDPETEHADANMYKDDGDGDGGDMKAKVYKTVWSPEVRPRSPRKPRFTCPCSKIGVVPLSVARSRPGSRPGSPRIVPMSRSFERSSRSRCRRGPRTLHPRVLHRILPPHDHSEDTPHVFAPSRLFSPVVFRPFEPRRRTPG